MLNRRILGRDSDRPGLSHRPTPVMVVESWQRMGVLKLDVPTRTPDLSERCTTSPKEAGCCQKREEYWAGKTVISTLSVASITFLSQQEKAFYH